MLSKHTEVKVKFCGDSCCCNKRKEESLVGTKTI
jgi:hypothetical protein